MTDKPAETMLTKMVTAMKAELARQCAANGYYSGPRNSRPNYLDGDYDQTLVAKAALEAIREPSEALAGVFLDRCCLGGDLIQKEDEHPLYSAWRAQIDAILNEEA